MLPHRTEHNQLPAACNVIPAWSYGAPRQQGVVPFRIPVQSSAGRGLNLRRPLLLLTQLSYGRGTACLQSLAEGNAPDNSRFLRGRMRQARRVLMAQAECGSRHTHSRARSGKRRAVAAAAVQRGSSERGLDKVEGNETPAEGRRLEDSVRPTPQQELLLLQLLASTTAREVHKKEFVLVACILGVDVVPALEQAGVDLNWLEGTEPPKEFLDAVLGCDNPPDVYWEFLSTLFEEGVKGRRKVLEQPAGAKKGFGTSSGGGGGKGRKTKPRKVKSSYALVSELKDKEQMREMERNAAEWAVHDAALNRLMEGWTQDERDAYVGATFFWDLGWAILLTGVREFFDAGCDGLLSVAACVELLAHVRAFMWRSINNTNVEENTGLPGGVKDALQGLVTQKLLDLIEAAAVMRINFEVPFRSSAAVSGLEDAALAQILEITQEQPSLMPLPPPMAFSPSASGGLSIVEELLARQVMGSVEAWQEVSVRDRMECLMAPGWREVRPVVERSFKTLNAEDARMAMNVLGLNFTGGDIEESLFPAFHISGTEVPLGSDESTAAEFAVDIQTPLQAVDVDVAADVATSADRRFTMYEAPPIDGPVLWQQGTPEPAGQLPMQAVAVELPTGSSEGQTDRTDQIRITSHAEADDASAGAEEQLASGDAAMDPIAPPEDAWSGVDSWAAAAASVGGVPFAALDQASPAALAEGPLDVRQQSTAAALSTTAGAAAEASRDTSQLSSSVEVGTTAEAAGVDVSADSDLSRSGAEQQNATGKPSADVITAADLAADSIQSSGDDGLQSRSDNVIANAVTAADRTSNGSRSSSASVDCNSADTAQANASGGSEAAAQTAAAHADSSLFNSNGEQQQRADKLVVEAVDAASEYDNDTLSGRSSKKGQSRTADGLRSDAAAAAGASANGARSSSGSWSTADGVEEPLDRREHFSSRGEGRASGAAEAPASSAASSTSPVRWSQLAVRPILPAEQRPHLEANSEVSSGSRQSRRRERAPFGGSVLVDGTYLAKQLLPHDQRHWKAAGILLYAHGQDGSLQLLLGRIDMGAKPAGSAKAFRRHEGWWILGGSRDATDFCAEATAVREMTEETAGILSGYNVCGDDFRQVLWYPPGMYAVFPYELQGRPDIPGRYARLRAMRGRVKGRRRQLMFRAAGHPKPMSQLAWVPLRDLINGRLRMHWILEDMLRRTPLLPYLLQMERLAAESASSTVRPLQLRGPTNELDRYPPTAKSGKGSPQRRSGGSPDRTSTQQNGAAASWTAPGGEERATAGVRPGNVRSAAAAVKSLDTAAAVDTDILYNNGHRSAAAVISSGTATAVDLDVMYNNGVAANAAAAAVMAGARSGTGAGARSGPDTAAAAAPEAAGLARPRAAEGEADFAAVAEAARKFLKARGAEVEAGEEGTQQEKHTGRALDRPVARTLKGRRRPRLKRIKLARAL